ncbi:MAG TPA: DUF4082 domain-containing protein, partial [Acidimicrobiales bacterium]
SRIYHSTALLMPDGRVLFAGGGHVSKGGPGQYSAQYYSPPYLFKGTRPSVTSAPSSTSYGSTFTVQTPDAASISSVSLVAMAADTHTEDMNQRYVPLTFSAGSGSLAIQAPSSSTIAPPGEYMLFIVNSTGVPSVASIVQINGSPAAPTNVLAAGANASATVSWTPPPNGGSAITQYTVTPYVGSTTQPATNVTGSPPATSATINGLTNGTTYTFTVSAINAVGRGPPSVASSTVMPSATATAPGAPTGVTATSNYTTTTVSWTAPSNGGSSITSYTVTPFAGPNAQAPTTVTGSPPATSTTFAGLTNGTSYTFTVSATNSVGTGPASAASNAVTPGTGPSCPCTILGSSIPAVADSGDGNSVELGVKFTSDVGGYITGVRFYKAATNAGTHVGNLWTLSGTLLASATFSGETASGWQQVSFPGGVAVTANTTYVASYLAPQGHYSATSGAFASAGVDNPPLHALATTTSANGVYLYTTANAFPTSTYNAANYWVDVAFSTTAPPAAAPAAPTATLTALEFQSSSPSTASLLADPKVAIRLAQTSNVFTCTLLLPRLPLAATSSVPTNGALNPPSTDSVVLGSPAFT